MARSKVLLLALAAALGVAFVPFFLPTGPSSSLDASKFLAGGQFAVAAAVIFLGGVLTSLTPCVYPLIPITVGVFGARQANSRAHAVVLTTAYVFGMGIVFATLGVVAALAGKAFGTVLANPIVIVVLIGFELALALSMFGAFEIALPSGLATKLNTVGGSGLIGALLMGGASGFLAAPCTGPVLSGVLTWVSKSQDPVIGGGLLFIYALGIGVPFFLIGVFLMRLPKGGVWMEWVKSFFGIALVALAVTYVPASFLRATVGVLAAQGTWAGVGLPAVLAGVGVLFGAIHFSFKDGTGSEAAMKFVGVLALVVALTVRLAPQPEPAAQPGHSHMEWASYKADTVNSVEPFNELLMKAKATCKPVMIDFFAEWCAACKELDAHTYTAKEVIAESDRFISIKVDGTNDHEVLDSLYERFGVKGLPTVAFVDTRGAVMNDPKVTGFMPPDQFLTELKKVHSGECSPGSP